MTSENSAVLFQIINFCDNKVIFTAKTQVVMIVIFSF